MRIIRLGQLPDVEQEQQATCPKCKTVFGFFVREVRFVDDGCDGDSYGMECPFCRGRVTYPASLIHQPTLSKDKIDG